MGQVLYRTYRSRTLDEVVGQEHITGALKTALTNGLISHAYLFTGPRGTGKTSVARILAHVINDLPYADDSLHLDIIEIDAASNRRIDEIRDLRDKVHIAPTSAKYKIYIIDEVHMLTREAFNALLKTLEEPPAHVIFILATTEVHKLPETIISRTQRFSFRPVALEKVIGHLRSIADQEKLQIDNDALTLIAQHGGGSFRDSISLLDQVRSIGRAVTADDVRQLLGTASEELISGLLGSIEHHDASQLLETLRQLQVQGAEAAQIAVQFGQLLRERFVSGDITLEHGQIIQLLTKLLDVPLSSNPAIFLEIILLDVTLIGRSAPTNVVPHKRPAASKLATETTTAASSASSQAHKAIATAVVPKDTAPVKSEPESDIVTPEQWAAILQLLKKKRTLYSFVTAARVSLTSDAITIATAFEFHQKQLNAPQNKKIIGGIVEQVCGKDYHIKCIFDKSATAAPVQHAGDGEVTHQVAPKTDRPDASQQQDVAAKTQQANNNQDNDTTNEPFDYYVQQAEQTAARPFDTVNAVFGGGELLGS